MQGNCTKENKYGFKDGTPCILLKLNRVSGKYLSESFSRKPVEVLMVSMTIWKDTKLVYVRVSLVVDGLMKER